MHPSLTEALGRERHAELLRRQRFRESATTRSGSVASRTRGPIPSIRHSLGSALVVAGTRLMTPNRTTAGWAVHGSSPDVPGR
jgi:hypothetical protein